LAISREAQMLLDRMDSDPDEFLNPFWDPIQDRVATPFNNVRWENILTPIFTAGKESLLGPEDTKHIEAKFKQMIQARTRECIIKELVMGTRHEVDEGGTQLRIPLNAANSRF